MIGQARFTYTDEDMVATQRAWWTWLASWRHLLVAGAGLTVLDGAFAAAMSAAHGTRTLHADLLFVICAPAAQIAACVAVMFVVARSHGLQMLRGRTPGVPWSGDEIGGEHDWAWDMDGLHMRRERGGADLSWTAVGAWLDAPDVLLLFPSESRAFALPERVLAAGWKDAPKVFLLAFGGYALVLPKRALDAGDAGRLVDMLRAAGVRERRRFGLIAATGFEARDPSLRFTRA